MVPRKKESEKLWLRSTVSWRTELTSLGLEDIGNHDGRNTAKQTSLKESAYAKEGRDSGSTIFFSEIRQQKAFPLLKFFFRDRSGS